MTLEAALEPLLHSPRLNEIVEALQARVRTERAARERFYEEMTEEQKVEFVDGEVVLHPPARKIHLIVQSNVEALLRTYVAIHKLGEVHGEKCLCVFPRNDYEPDVVFFARDKAATLGPNTMKFPVPDLVVEILSESTVARDRGVKFEDYEAHGVAEYWIVDTEAERLEQYLLQDGQFELALKSGTGELESPTIAGLRIPLRVVFDETENLEVVRGLLAGVG
jgi:Uma2 family endonuclease